MTKYVFLVGSSIVQRWDNFSNVSKKIIFNFGVSRFITNNILQKEYLKSLVVGKKYSNGIEHLIYPEYLIYYCGNNDLLHDINPNIIIKNIKKFLLYAKKMFKDKTKIVYLSLLKSPKKYILGHENLIDYINYNILLFCNKHNFIYIELNFLLNAKNDYLKDGVHLTNKGYNKINNLLKFKKIL